MKKIRHLKIHCKLWNIVTVCVCFGTSFGRATQDEEWLSQRTNIYLAEELSKGHRTNAIKLKRCCKITAHKMPKIKPNCFKKSCEMSKKVSYRQRSQWQSYCAFTIRRLNACSRIKSSLWARGRGTPAQTPKPVPITYEGNLDNSDPWLFSWPFGKNCTNRIHRNILLCNKIF